MINLLPCVMFLALAGMTLPKPAQRPSGDLLVAAAASLSGVIPALAQPFHDATGLRIRVNYGGSNTLARQIVSGARVDVFISADFGQMEVVERAGRIAGTSRFDLLGNQLVIASALSGSLSWPGTLAAPVVRRVAMGDPAAVPAGVYGRKWLESIGLWPAVAPKVVPLPTSPAALAAVREGRAEAAIVYATDARLLPAGGAARIAHVVAIGEAPPIVYPAAAIRGGREEEAGAFLQFLRGREAGAAFEAAGFRHLPSRR